MRSIKTTTVSARLPEATRKKLYRKAKQENGHDVSTVLRALIDLYISNSVQLPRTDK